MKIIQTGKPRRCVFTNNVSNATLEINHYKDKHNPAKKLPCCREYLSFREKYMGPDLYLLEESVFLSYWRIESELCVKNANKVDYSDLVALQEAILDMMCVFRNKDLDFKEELKHRLQRILANNPEMVKYDVFGVLKDK